MSAPLPLAARRVTRSGPVAVLLAGHPAASDALAALLGCAGAWQPGGGQATDHPAQGLL